MKLLALPFYLVLIIGCNQNTQIQNDNKSNSNKSNYASELIANGFLKYADSSKIDSLKDQVINSFNIYLDDNFRIAHIDAEELAEFNFGFFLPKLNRILSKRSVTLAFRKLNDKENSFDVLVSGDTIQLYTQKDLDNDTFWDTAPRNFFKKVNELLKKKDSDEQFYLLYGGNDLHTLLLTEKQFSIICRYYKNNIKETPYIP